MGVRPNLRHFALAAIAAGAVAVSGCGSAAAPGGGSSAPGGSASPGRTSGSGGSHTAKIDLAFTMTNGPGKAPVRRTVHCDPPGGANPDQPVLCTELLHLKMIGRHPFSPASKHVMCPMIMMSDRQIVVEGTWNGVKVHRVIVDGGCDVALFQSMFKLLR